MPNLLPVLTSLVVALLLVWSAFASNYCLNHEASIWLLHYFSPQPFWQTIFNAQGTEYGIFRARELGYVFDWVDARIVMSRILVGKFFFISVMYYVFVVGIVLLYIRIARTVAKISWLPILLMLSVFLASPVMHLSGMYFRNAKILTAFLLTVSLLFCIDLFRPRPDLVPASREPLLFFLVLVGLSLADEQGIAFAAGISGLLALSYLLVRDPKYFRFSVSGVMAIGVYVAYRMFFGPYLVKHVGGFSVDRKVQDFYRPHAGEIFSIVDLKYGSEFVRKSTVLFFGNSHLLAATFFVALLAVVWSNRLWRRDIELLQARWRRCTLFVGLLFILVFPYSLLVRRHPGMLHENVIRIYYALPLVCVILLLALLIYQKAVGLGPRIRLSALGFLFLSCALSLAQVREHEQLFQAKPVNALGSIPIRDCLTSGPAGFDATFQHHTEYFHFCKEIHRFREAVPSR